MTLGMLKFFTKSVDTTNSYSTDTGLFEVPVSGRYIFRIHVMSYCYGSSKLYRNNWMVCLSVDGQCGKYYYTDITQYAAYRYYSTLYEEEINVSKGDAVGWDLISVGSSIQFDANSFFEATMVHEI